MPSLKGRQSSKNKRSGKYLKQKSRTAANRIRKLQKHLKKFPGDAVAAKALL